MRTTTLLGPLAGLSLLSLIAPSGALAQNKPRELGAVTWSRDLDATLEKLRGAKSSKPVFLLFQEVPG